MSSVRSSPKKRLAERDREENSSSWKVVCQCGEHLQGQRIKKAQIVPCSRCDRPQFVLPLNRYEISFRPRKQNKFRPLAFKPRLQGSGQLAAQGGNWLLQSARQVVVQTRQNIEQAAQATVKWFTPLRSALVGLAVITLLAGSLGIRQHWQQEAIQELRTASQQAEQALANQKWIEATDACRRAARAIQFLGREDLFSREILQQNRELQAVARLSPLTLEEMLLEATGRGKTRGDWAYTYESQVKKRWVVMLCQLQGTEDQEWVSLAQPIPLADEWLNIRWPRRLIPPRSGKGEQPVSVLIAGPIQSLERSELPGETWVLTIDPEQAFLWVSPETCAAAGLDLEAPWLQNPPLKTVLEQQRPLVLGEE